MCGITCVLSREPEPLAGLLRAMTDTVRHRGPDDEGYLLLAGSEAVICHGDDTEPAALEVPLPWRPVCHVTDVAETANLGLGHRRLSIVDPSPLGHQPMSYADGRYWIVHNGEVYNHVELREELRALGHAFVSQSDTEVILAAYAQWGATCLERFNGMWAFAILDRRARTLFVARDRFGVKPLYYHAYRGLLAFVSEIKQLTVLPSWRARLNAQRGYDFLVWNVMDHTDETLFAGVYQVPAGHFALVPLDDPGRPMDARGRLHTQAWYRLEPPVFEGSFEDAAKEFGRLITESVRLRLRADVAVGSCLSGGLDSSTIVCLMRGLLRELGSDRQATFSACSDVASVDERAWIDLVVRQTGVDGHQVMPTVDGLFEELPALGWHQDEPFGSTSIYAQWCVFRLAGRAGIKVMLDGQGADEQLAGYHGFVAPLLVGLLRSGRLIELSREVVALRRRLGYSPMYAAQRMADMLLPDSLRQPLRRMAGQPSASRNRWLDRARLGSATIDPVAGAGEQTGSVRAMSRSLMLARHLPMLLHWEDRSSMAHSIEARVPFLDYRLVEFSLSLPDSFKLRCGLTKRVMRAAMKGVLPEPVRRRADKIGFATPEQTWMREHTPDRFRATLRDAIVQSRGVLTPHALVVLEDVLAGRRPFSFLPWRMISFGRWMERFGVAPR